MVTLIIIIINMVDYAPQQSIHTQKYETMSQCVNVANEIKKIQIEEVSKHRADSSEQAIKSYQKAVIVKCVNNFTKQ